ncbi:C-terminal domain of homeodomain 1-domain-containing protein [Armillaria mellea]|nr:C-terminal domain of homeodomain 1-domain-containing protein [Armillaria mellea]
MLSHSSKPHTSAYIEPAYAGLSITSTIPTQLARSVAKSAAKPTPGAENSTTGLPTPGGASAGTPSSRALAATAIVSSKPPPPTSSAKRTTDTIPISIAFADMESTLADLYSGKFEQSTLGWKLGGVVKNMTPELQAQEQANKKKREEQREAEKRAKKARMEKARQVDARRAYPSPERSPGRSVDPSLPSEATPSRKRRSSDDDEDGGSDAHRSKKRSRTDDVEYAVTGLLSPSATDTEASGSSRDSTPTALTIQAEEASIRFGRRRTKTECRPVELYVPPNLEGWFETASAEFPPDPEVDVFNYSAMSPSSQYSDETESSAGPSTPRSITPAESSIDGIAPSVTLLNNGSILDSISTPEFSVSGLDLEGLMPTAVPAEKQPDSTHFSDLDAFLETFSFSGNNLFNASTDFADVDFSSSSSTWKLAEDWLMPS